MAIAVAASTTTQPRGSMHTSCLELPENSMRLFVVMSKAYCLEAMVGTGLKHTEKIIGIPFVIPPFIPPELFVIVVPLGQKASFASLPSKLAKPKPSPNSIP